LSETTYKRLALGWSSGPPTPNILIFKGIAPSVGSHRRRPPRHRFVP